MIRGLEFEVPNKRFAVLYLILKDIGIENYFWFLVQEDVIDNFFVKDIYLGSEFEKIINDDTCYAVFINLQAYMRKDDFVVINNYDDYLKSKCELVLFINDNSYIDIYAKDNTVINIIKKNAEINKFKNIRYITDENDTRDKFEA